ncbi:uncharacterized protein LOC135822657 [Sycon ciliatum]|uniref:uncharacterized protein LOC135822657 n=1 Tax=Sycon ciliatum TaxID=27933 RepID=UPI0031F70488
MGSAVSKHSRFSCRRPENKDVAPYLPQFDVAHRRYFKFASYERSDVQCGSGRAEVTENALILFSHINSETIPLNCIRRYGFESKCFMFVTGQRCPSGEATHRIWMEKAEDIMIELDRTLAWRRQMLEKTAMLEEEALKSNKLKDPSDSSLLQRRNQAMNSYVTEPAVAERRRRTRKRRERDPTTTTSSDTDSRSDLDRASTQAAGQASAGHRQDSPKNGSLLGSTSVDVISTRQGSKSGSPSKASSQRIRLGGESGSESTSSRHRSHRPPRARSRHSNSYKPGTGMSTHFESQLLDAHSHSLDTLDLSSSDVGATEDCSTTETYRSLSTSTNEVETMSVHSQHSVSAARLHANLPTSAFSVSPSSTNTIVPVSCKSALPVLKPEASRSDSSDSDKTLCAASPSSTDKFSPNVPTSSSSSSTSSITQPRKSTAAQLCSGCAEIVYTTPSVYHRHAGDNSEEEMTCSTPPFANSTRNSCCLVSNSSATLCSSASTLHHDMPDMVEETDSPPMTANSPPAAPGRHDIVTSFSLGGSNTSLSSLGQTSGASKSSVPHEDDHEDEDPHSCCISGLNQADGDHTDLSDSEC